MPVALSAYFETLSLKAGASIALDASLCVSRQHSSFPLAAVVALGGQTCLPAALARQPFQMPCKEFPALKCSFHRRRAAPVVTVLGNLHVKLLDLVPANLNRQAARVVLDWIVDAMPHLSWTALRAIALQRRSGT